MIVNGAGKSRERGRRDGLPTQLWFWIGASSASAIGSGVAQVGLTWTAAGIGGQAAGWVNALGILPTALLVLIGGAVGDKLGQRQVLVLTTCASIAQYLLLLVCLGLDVPLLLLLCLNALARGAVDGLAGPSLSVLARQLVGSEQVPRAIAISNTATLSARMIAPALGGVIVGALALEGAVWSNLICLAGVLAVLLTLAPHSSQSPVNGGGVWKDIVAGVRQLAGNRRLVVLLGSLVVVAGGLLPVTGLALPLLVRDRGWGAPSLGAIEAAWAAGSLIASLLIARRGPSDRPAAPMVGGTLLAAAAGVVLAYSPSPAVAIVAACMMGLGTVTYAGHLSPVFVHLTPAAALSRYTSVLILMQILPALVASPIIGELSHWIGTTSTLVMSSSVVLAAPLILLASPAIRSLRIVND